MMPNSNLTPTLIVDATGKTTTVYRRTSAATAAASLPAPRVKLDTESPERTDAMRALGMRIPSRISAEGEIMHQTIATYPTDLVKKLAVVPPNTFYRVGQMIGNQATGDEVSQFLAFERDMKKVSFSKTYLLSASLQEYPQLPASENYSKEDFDVRAQCSALIQVASAITTLGSEGRNGPPEKIDEVVIKDDRLVELVIANPDRAEQISNLIIERQSADYGLIESTITGSAALSPGVL